METTWHAAVWRVTEVKLSPSIFILSSFLTQVLIVYKLINKISLYDIIDFHLKTLIFL